MAHLDKNVIKKRLMMTDDGYFINVITCRKIKWSDEKEKKMFFHKKYRICCPKSFNERVWKHFIKEFNLSEKIKIYDPYDHFDWAEDQGRKVLNKNGHMDYIAS